MGDAQGIPIGGAQPTRSATSETGPAPAQVAELAREFEAVLIAQMLRQMRQSFLAEEEQDTGFGGETLADTVDVELGRALASQGGVGLAAIIERSLSDAVESQGGSDDLSGQRGFGLPSGIVGPSTRPVLPVALPGASSVGRHERTGRVAGEPASPEPAPGPGEVSLATPLNSEVTSGYGWRTDPFHGLRRFHAGVDFRAAYGREVPTAAPGRVVFAGEQGGYGQTVVVEHADGLQTRYAHLSAILVSAGQELASENPVGRVGQSGRATGPHLHFEVVLNGRRVDPARLALALPGALKPAGPDVDSSFDRVPAATPGDRSEP